MHELSIVLSIVDIADEEVKKHNAHHVDSINLEIGAVAGVEFDALNFVWDAAVKNSVLDGASRHIDVVKAKARCIDCGCVFEVNDRFQACPVCHDYFTELLQGKELKVKSLTLVKL
jgi:hydrogenase nickel incorporation protein HypA/HybF